MKSLEELIDEINKSKLPSVYHIVDSFPVLKGNEITTVDSCEHRWYLSGITVFKVGKRFLGVCGPISLKSEDSAFEDLYIECKAFEMEEIPSVTYQKKSTKNNN